MSDLSYLDAGLTSASGMREDLGRHVRAVAVEWCKAGIDPAPVEVASELLARMSTELGDDAVNKEELDEALAWLSLAPEVLELLGHVARNGLDATGLSALAVHLLDLAEALAIEVFVPELVGLTARSDRSGEAARRVGTARYLRG